MSSGYLLGPGTSFAAPQVTGAVALMASSTIPAGIRLSFGTAGEANHLAAKAILLNSARKRFINGPESNPATWIITDRPNTETQPSDGEYLDGNGIRKNASAGTAPRTSGWTPSAWTSDGNGVISIIKPLDDEQGTGLLDVERMIIQQFSGKQGPGNVGMIGWDLNELSPNTSTKTYNLNGQINQGQFITATLAWDRVQDENDGDNQIESDDSYLDRPPGPNDLGTLPDFNLTIYKGNVKIAESIATSAGQDGENVEHLHIPVPAGGNDYKIEVKLLGDNTITKNYKYSLAWWAPKN
jgi:hypothetical protein